MNGTETDDSAERADSATEARNLEVVAEAVTYWNAHDLDTLLTLYDPEIQWFNAPLEQTYRGHGEVRAFLASLITAFPDLVFTVDSRFARGDQVSEQWSIEGTHLGSFVGVPPTGRRLRLQGISSIVMRDGRFLRDDFYFDSMSAMRVLGVMPSLDAVQSPVGRLLLNAIVQPQKLLRRK